MPEARINESCIIGLPTCGYAFSSSRMAFIAAPADEEFRLELDVLETLLRDKDYEAYIALQRIDPAKLAWHTFVLQAFHPVGDTDRELAKHVGPIPDAGVVGARAADEVNAGGKRGKAKGFHAGIRRGAPVSQSGSRRSVLVGDA